MEPLQVDALFGQWVRRRRRALELTQKGLARRVGCSTVMVRKIEREERRPSVRMAAALAEALGVPAAERDAFTRFARGGWADRPPSGARPDLGHPWLLHDAQAGFEPPHGAAPRPRGGADEPTATPVQVPDAPHLVARERELRRLDQELELALAGQGRTVIVLGEPGQGKTALMHAFAAAAQAAHPDLVVAVGTCNAFTGRGDPFLPFRQVLAQLAGEVPAGPHLDAYHRERAARLQRAMPRASQALLRHGPHLLGTLVAVEPLRARLRGAGIALRSPARAIAASTTAPFQHSPEHDRQALRAETAATLAAIAEHVPLLLVLDDLHWLDGSSAELLLHLAKVAPGRPLLLLGAYRPHDLPTSSAGRPLHPLRELAAAGTAVVDLDRSDGRAFVEALLDSESNTLDHAFRESLWQQTAGHPLFTIELLRALQQRGDLVKDGAGRWVAAPDLRWTAAPGRVADALAARMERLDAPSADILRVASVEGEVFTAEIVARVLHLEPRHVVRTLSAELDRNHHLVAPVDVERGRRGLVSRYRFRHNLIQGFVYDAIDPGERAYLHQAIGQALEELLVDAADPVALAYHFMLAHNPGRAAAHHRKAGDRARNAHATDQAVSHYLAALEHWPDGDPLARAALQRALGECQYRLLQREEATHNLTEACAAFEAAGELRSAGVAQRTLALIFTTSDDFEQAFDASRQAVAKLEPSGDSAELAAALNTLARVHMLVSEPEQALACAERAMAMAERLGAVDVLVQARIRVGSVLHQLGPSRRLEGVPLLETSIRLADRQGLAYDASHAAYNLADVLVAVGRYSEARTRLQAAVAHARRHQVTNFEYYGRYALWRYLWAHGHWSEAFEQLPLVQRIVDGTAHADFQMSRFAFDLASGDLDLGRVEEAHATLARHATALRQLARPGERLPNLAVHLRLAASEGDPRQAADLAAAIADAVNPLPPNEYEIVGAVLEAFRHLRGRPSRAADARAAACLEALERLERQYRSPEARAAMCEAQALYAATNGSEAEAATLWRRAADHWQAGTFPLREARARAAAARALRRAVDPSGAAAEGDRARELLVSLADQIPSDELQASFAQVTRRMLAPGGSGPR